MIIKTSSDLRYSEITPKAAYLNRRQILASIPAAFGIGSILASRPARATTKLGDLCKSPLSTTEKQNTYKEITTYNNFYEFGTRKDQPAEWAKDFKTDPWSVSVEGAVAKPRSFTIQELMAVAPLEERIYRHRCVEGWSMVAPWIGYSLSELLKQVKPTSKASFVGFETAFDPNQMPHAAGLTFPYVEGLRLDEASHPLTILTFGLYGETLPPQDGAPVRLTVPWKYGFKSAKSIVKIKLLEQQPPTSWNQRKPQEYGFYANVNPKVDHPRWSQATERRLGELSRRPTLPFNGYEDAVGNLYSGLDLVKNF